MTEYKDQISSLKSTINHLKIEFEQFHKAGENFHSSDKAPSTTQKAGLVENMPQPEQWLGSEENITFDIFTPHEMQIGRNPLNNSAFVGVKENYDSSKENRRHSHGNYGSQRNKITPTRKRFFKFQNQNDSMNIMSFGKKEDTSNSQTRKGSTKRSSKSKHYSMNNTLRDTTNLPQKGLGESMRPKEYKMPNIETIESWRSNKQYKPTAYKDSGKSFLTILSLYQSHSNPYVTGNEKVTEETGESLTRFFDKNSNQKSPNFVENLIQENEQLHRKVAHLESEIKVQKEQNKIDRGNTIALLFRHF